MGIEEWLDNEKKDYWLVVSTPLKNISQLGFLFPTEWKIIKIMFHHVPVTTNQWLETPNGNPNCGCTHQIRSSTPRYPLSGWRISHELSHFNAKISTFIKILIGYASELSPQSGLFQILFSHTSRLYPFATLVRVFWRETTNFGSKTSASLDSNAYKLGQTYNFIVLGSHAPLYPYTIIPYIDNCLDNNGN